MAFLGRRLLILGKFLSNATLPGTRRFSLTAPVRDPNYHPQQKGVPAATMPFDVGENRGKFTFNTTFYMVTAVTIPFYLVIWHMTRKNGPRSDQEKQEYCARCREKCSCCYDEVDR